MQSMIDNFINGNLKTAKDQAKNYGANSIFKALVNWYGWDQMKAAKATQYLKNPSQATWDAYCAC